MSTWDPTDVESSWTLERSSDTGRNQWVLNITLTASLGEPPRAEAQTAIDDILDRVLPTDRAEYDPNEAGYCANCTLHGREHDHGFCP